MSKFYHISNGNVYGPATSDVRTLADYAKVIRKAYGSLRGIRVYQAENATDAREQWMQSIGHPPSAKRNSIKPRASERGFFPKAAKKRARTVVNRWGDALTVGLPVIVRRNDGTKLLSTITGFVTSGDYVKAYGKHARIDTGALVSIDDISPRPPVKNPARKRNPAGGIRIVHNRLLGGWYVVRGPHQTPLNGRFDSKAEAQAWLQRKNPITTRGQLQQMGLDYLEYAKEGLGVIWNTRTDKKIFEGSIAEAREKLNARVPGGVSFPARKNPARSKRPGASGYSPRALAARKKIGQSKSRNVLMGRYLVQVKDLGKWFTYRIHDTKEKAITDANRIAKENPKAVLRVYWQ